MTQMTEDLLIDLDRSRITIGDPTGIYVRAKNPETNKWLNADIAILTYRSLMIWLRSRGGENRWAESTVALLLGHAEDVAAEAKRPSTTTPSQPGPSGDSDPSAASNHR